MKNCGSCANYDRTKMEHTDVCGGCVTVYVGDVRQEPSRWKPIPQTNADRIRAWNDHELAQTIADFVSEIDNGDVRYSDDPNDWLEWLQQPVKEE